MMFIKLELVKYNILFFFFVVNKKKERRVSKIYTWNALT